MASASSLVPCVRLEWISRLTFGVQRSAAMLLPARCTTASALDSASESMVPPAGSQRAAPGPGLGERVRRRTSWPSPTRLETSADPISPVDPVTATSMFATVSSGSILACCGLASGDAGAALAARRGGSLGIGTAVAGAAQDAACELEPGHPLAHRLGKRLGEPLRTVQHDHLVDRTERLGGSLHDRRPVLGELLADHRILVLREGVGSRLDGIGLGQATRPGGVGL